MCSLILLCLVLLVAAASGNVQLIIWNNQTGRCTTNYYFAPTVAVRKEDKSRCVIEATRRKGYTDFTVHGVEKSCRIECFAGLSYKNGTIYEPAHKIVSAPQNRTIGSGLPVTFDCSVMRRDLLFHQLLWMKGDAFVGVDENHSLRLSHRDNISIYWLTIHAAMETANYSCVLVSSDGKIVDSVTQFVFIEEVDPLVSQTVKYLTQYFSWSKPEYQPRPFEDKTVEA